MPRKKSTPALDTPEQTVIQGKFWTANDAVWGGFINISISDSEKDEFHNWEVEHSHEVASYLEDLLAEGMKVGISYDRENECAIMTLTGSLISGSNHRWCMTTRAKDLGDVSALTVWKHYVLCGGNYDDLMPRTGRKQSWG